MKQIRFVLLAGTVIASALPVAAWAVDAANAPVLLAQAPPPPENGEQPPQRRQQQQQQQRDGSEGGQRRAPSNEPQQRQRPERQGGGEQQQRPERRQGGEQGRPEGGQRPQREPQQQAPEAPRAPRAPQVQEAPPAPRAPQTQQAPDQEPQQRPERPRREEGQQPRGQRPDQAPRAPEPPAPPVQPRATPPAATSPDSAPPASQQPRGQRPDAPPAPSTGASPGQPPIPPGIQAPGQRDNRGPEGRPGEGRRGPNDQPRLDDRAAPETIPAPNGRPGPDGRLGPDGRPLPDGRPGADGRRGPDSRLGPDTTGPIREPGQEFRGGAERQGGGEFRRFDPERRESRDDDRRDRRFDQEFGRREERQGDRLIIREGNDRTIIREGGRTIIRHDETERLRRRAEDVRVDRRGNEIETVIRRPGGVEIVTIQDDNGRLLRRIRRQGGRDYVLIDNRPRRPGMSIYLDLPPVRVGIPREEYIVEADDAGYDDYYEAFDAPPVEAIDRPYTLEEVRQNVRLRDRVRSVDVNTINFEFGEFTIPPDQVPKLQELAQAIGAVIEKNPNEVFLIEGHTDAVGSDIDNLSLSDRRAEEVAAILSETYQIPAENLVTQGYGEQYLRVDTEGPSGENRRVTLRNITPLLNAEQQQQQPPQ